MSIGVALIGAGKMAAVHAANIAAEADARLVVVAGGTGAPSLAARYHAETAEVAAAVARPDVDAVVIASPNAFHAEQIVLAVEAGKAALVEKPVDLSLERVDACLEAVGAAACRVVVAFNRRFDPSFARARERVVAGDIGDLTQLLIVSRDPAPPPLDYIPGSGGLFRDMTIHDLDLARHFVGEIVALSAVSQAVDPNISALGDVDGATVTLRAASGVIVTIINSRRNAAGYEQRLEAFGRRGTLCVDSPSADLVRFSGHGTVDARSALIDHYADRYASAYRAELTNLIAVTRGTASPGATLADGRAALLLAEAADRSATEGREVAVA
jgi:myo-inositol 2-dehydrogenase/D-chiro-inositol 1-dehydrogenase